MTLRNLAGAAMLAGCLAAMVAATVWKFGPTVLVVWAGAVAMALVIVKAVDLLLES